MQTTRNAQMTTCFHCGETCKEGLVIFESKHFCCEGCKSVYYLLESNQLCDYYAFDATPGHTPVTYHAEKWAFLDNEPLSDSLLQFKSPNLHIFSFTIPAMHCASCIYLLENLAQVLPGVIASQVNFLRKELTVRFNPAEVSLRLIVERLCQIGYSPSIQLDALERKEIKKGSRTLTYKIGVAGFFFGNIMMLSMPEYLDVKGLLTESLSGVFRWLNCLLILPVMLYSAADYFKTSWYAIKTRTMNMDLPITFGLAGLLVQSYFDVLTGAGGGYFDSISGLVFMLLVGKFFQQRTTDALSFDRDYKAFFPLAVTRFGKKGQESININNLTPGDTILVRSGELIPADGLLESADASVDFAFVTGESDPLQCRKGQLIHAGGRNCGTAITLKVVHAVSQSYLTKLWNNEAFNKERHQGWSRWAATLAKYFTIAVILIATATAVYWKLTDASMMMRAVTSVLIVACPCVMALTVPFTFGHVMRIFGSKGFYLKNAESIEELALVDSIVFDKTGTLTEASRSTITYEGTQLSDDEKRLLAGLAAHSSHPVSRLISKAMNDVEGSALISNWHETLGQGISAEVEGHSISLQKGDNAGTFLSIDGKRKGAYRIMHLFRKDTDNLLSSLRKHFNLYLLSGDNDQDAPWLAPHFESDKLKFRQSPEDKLRFIKKLKARGANVMMIGDGLNDAGALRESQFGVTITDDTNGFTPASDAILDSKSFGLLPNIVGAAKATKRVIYGSFIFSLAYNIFGIGIAAQGLLHPLVAAILMPVSSITVLLYAWLSTHYLKRKYKLN